MEVVESGVETFGLSDLKGTIGAGETPIFMRILAPMPLSARRGMSNLKFVVALPPLIMITWFAAEYGLALRSAGHARAAADAIALAAAGRYRDGHAAARQDALTAAAAGRSPNGPVVVSIAAGPGGGGDVEFGRWDDDTHTFTADPEGGPAVRVRVRFDQTGPNGTPSLPLRRLFGTPPVAIERQAVAVNVPPRHMTSVLLQGTGASVLDLGDTVTLSARGGVSAGSSDGLAFAVSGTPRIRVPVVRGGGAVPASVSAVSDGVVESLAAIAADPFAGVSLPSLSGGDPADVISHDQSGTTHVAAGAHAGLSASGGVVVLDPGLHQFIGPIELQGSAVLQLDGACIQLLDGIGLSVSGSASVVGTPLQAETDWPGFWMLQAATSPASWQVSGSGSVSVEGHAYAPAAELSVSDGGAVSMDTAVLGKVIGRGTGTIAFTDDIEPLRTEPVPGRARLVR